MSGVFAIFIDGPLAQETMMLPEAMPIYLVPVIPERVTICVCDEPEGFEFAKVENFKYYRVAHGPKVAIYSKDNSDEAIQQSLTMWVKTDIQGTDKWVSYCRDRRAWK